MHNVKVAQVSLKSNAVWLRYEKTNISNKLNHKPQAHARVCEENKEKNDCRLKYFVVKGSTLEACRRTVKPGIPPIFTRRTVQNIKVLILYKLKQHCVCKASFGCSHGNHCQKSWVGWFFRTGGPICSIFGLLILLS